MTEFNQRTIANNETLGERLQRARLHQRRSVQDVARDLQIRPDYITAIEASDYKALPGAVFVKNYVRKYAKYLRIGRQATEELLIDELAVYESTPDIPTTTKHLSKQPLQVRQVVIGLAIILLGIGVGTYLSFAISNIIQPPSLTLDSLPEKTTTEQRSVIVSGKTAPEALILINDQSVPVKSDGSFSQSMTLQPGINLFKVVAKTKRSKERIEYQQVVVE